MTAISLLSFLACFAAIALGWSRIGVHRLWLFVLLLIVHTGAALVFHQYSLTAVADSYGYYYLSYLWIRADASGTTFVIQVVDFLKSFGASYLDTFFVFQAVGFAGLMLLARTFREIEERFQFEAATGYVGLLFIPSVNFWTAAIGKDAPLFFAISLSVWAMIRLRQRFVAFVIALAIMLLFRAHIGLMAVSSLAAATLLGGSVSAGRRAGLLFASVIGIYFALGAVRNQFGIDASSASDVSGFLIKQNSAYENVAGTTSVGSAPWLYRIISLLFRPLFFDASGPLAVVASIENLGVIAMVIYFFRRWRELIHLFRHVLLIRFACIFAVVLLFSLTLVYYNVGLGLRQRVMAYPMVFSILVAVWCLRAKRAALAHAGPFVPTAPAALPAMQRNPS